MEEIADAMARESVLRARKVELLQGLTEIAREESVVKDRKNELIRQNLRSVTISGNQIENLHIYGEARE